MIVNSKGTLPMCPNKMGSGACVANKCMAFRYIDDGREEGYCGLGGAPLALLKKVQIQAGHSLLSGKTEAQKIIYLVIGLYEGRSCLLFRSKNAVDCDKFLAHYEHDSRYSNMVKTSLLEF